MRYFALSMIPGGDKNGKILNDIVEESGKWRVASGEKKEETLISCHFSLATCPFKRSPCHFMEGVILYEIAKIARFFPSH
jgi:hypothetical protein